MGSLLDLSRLLFFIFLLYNSHFYINFRVEIKTINKYIMKSFEITQKEIDVCIRGLLCLYNERGLSEEEQSLLDKLMKLSAL